MKELKNIMMSVVMGFFFFLGWELTNASPSLIAGTMLTIFTSYFISIQELSSELSEKVKE